MLVNGLVGTTTLQTTPGYIWYNMGLPQTGVPQKVCNKPTNPYYLVEIQHLVAMAPKQPRADDQEFLATVNELEGVRIPRIHPSKGYLLRCSELWGNKNDLSAQLQFQVLKPNLSDVSFLKSLHIKHIFRIFWGLSWRGTQ